MYMQLNLDICTKHISQGEPIGNVMELWHGTRVENVLSILKGGLIIPKSSAGHVTGRMFGDGVYFSDQSTNPLTTLKDIGDMEQRTITVLCS